MFRTIGVFLACAWDAIIRLPASRRIAKLPTPERETASIPYMHSMLKNITRRIGCRIVYHGLENLPENETFFMISNHQSYLDPVVLYPVMDRPTGFVGKIELLHTPFIAYWMRNIGCLFMDRSDIRQSLQIIKQTAEKMNNGVNMLIFPEGTRCKGGPTHEFKAGALKPAFIAGKKVVPICLENVCNLFEANGYRVNPNVEVNVYIGKPIETKDMTKAEQRELAANMEQLIFSQKELIP